MRFFDWLRIDIEAMADNEDLRGAEQRRLAGRIRDLEARLRDETVTPAIVVPAR